MDYATDSTPFRPTVWYVAFVGRKRQAWFDVLSPDWARHVMAFGYIPASDHWLVVNPVLHLHEINAVPDEYIRPILTELYMHDVRILKIRQQPGSAYSARLGNWCTQTVARTIGLRTRAFRPIALYRDLVRAGAVPAFEEQDERQSQGPEDRGRSGDEETSGAG